MFILKNAWRSITRARGRNVLICIIVLVIALASCLGLSIRQSAKKASESGLEGVEITAQISFDRGSQMQKIEPGDDMSREDMKDAMNDVFQGGMEDVSAEELMKYSEAPSVKDFYYSATASFSSDEEIEAVNASSSSSSSSSSDSSEENGNSFRGGPGGFGGMDMSSFMGTQGDFTVVGYSNEKAMTDFVNGTCAITDGEIFEEGTEENQCIISSELAQYNSLEAGDKITLINPNDEEEAVTLTITGIYTDSSSTSVQSGFMGGFSASSDPANKIYMSYNALKNIIDKSEKNATETTDEETGRVTSTAIKMQTSGTYVFDNREDYEKFEDEARELGLSDEYKVSSDDISKYEQSLVPLESLSEYATYFFIVVMAIGVVVLVVINIFNIRERKYEIGVLTAIGMKKKKVGMQFVTEIFITTFIAVIIGTAIGSVISVPVTNALLEAQVTQQSEESDRIEQNFGRMPSGGNTGEASSQRPDMGGFSMNFENMREDAENYVTEVTSATDFVVVLQLIAIGIALTLVSSAAALVFVMRYEPMKILSNRE